MNLLDKVIGYVSPTRGLQRAHARKVLERSYAGAESNRLTNNKKPRNLSADQELMGPFGADSMRAWARSMVRDNAYAWNVVDTIVSNVIGDGITAQSIFETPEGSDVENVNDLRDKAWSEWCEVADINGRLTFSEIQILAMREIVEAGEVLIKKIRTPGKEYKGISRPIPFALELIEADRLALERDTYKSGGIRGNNKVVRGVEIDDKGKPVAYWIYPQHPNSPYQIGNQDPERVPAEEILHLYRMDRIGQTRGISWFAPIMSPMRDLGTYIDNELQASAVASCFGVVIKTDGPTGSLQAPMGEDTTDSNGNTLDYLEPGMITRVRPGESIEVVNPSRPNSGAEPWINLMLRGISAGTGTNYEAIAKDFSKTSYSSSRSSKLEDRPRYKRTQNYIVWHLCQPVWDEFCTIAAINDVDGFPTSTELLEDRRGVAPVEWQLPEQDWVDPTSEQSAAEAAIKSNTTTVQNVCGGKGMSWRAVYYQRAKEEALRKKLGLLTEQEITAQMMARQTESNAPVDSTGGEASVDVASLALNGAQVTSLVDVITQVGTGAMPKETAKPVLKAAFPSFSDELIASIIDPIEPGSISADGVPTAASTAVEGEQAETGTGEWMGLSRRQLTNNRKALTDVLNGLADGSMSEALARAQLSMIGLAPENIDAIVADATDGEVSNPLPAEVASE